MLSHRSGNLETVHSALSAGHGAGQLKTGRRTAPGVSPTTAPYVPRPRDLDTVLVDLADTAMRLPKSTKAACRYGEPEPDNLTKHLTPTVPVGPPSPTAPYPPPRLGWHRFKSDATTLCVTPPVRQSHHAVSRAHNPRAAPRQPAPAMSTQHTRRSPPRRRGRRGAP